MFSKGVEFERIVDESVGGVCVNIGIGRDCLVYFVFYTVVLVWFVVNMKAWK